ncbi:MAG: radical SAM protein [Candidatus Heimdallarchaeota archaeon]
MPTSKVFALKERNIIRKRNYDLRVALIYPNLYQVASSCLAPRIIYDLLNDMEGVYCERVFQSEIDTVPPSSIETGNYLGTYKHILGTVQFELDYANLCKMLEQSGIPFLRKEREKQKLPHILVLGGPVPTANPLLASGIADAVFLGEIEPVCDAMIESFREFSREAVLHSLSGVPGFWVPSQIPYPTKVVRTTRFHTPLAQVIPVQDSKKQSGTFSDHFLMEISRGCSRGCAFCLIGHMKRPACHAPVSDLLESATKGIATTGARRISLIGSSAADHPELFDLLSRLNLQHVPFALPSLRIDSDLRIIEELVKTGQKTITIAPESHLEEERYSLGKKFSNDAIFDYVSSVGKANIRDLRAYLITGIPETQFSTKASLTHWKNEMESFVTDMRKHFDRGRIRFSLAPFIPKPHTTFQNRIPDFERMKKEQDVCIPIFKRAKIRLSLGSLRWAPVQAFLSMAGEADASIIREVSLKGGQLAIWKKTVGNFTHLLEKEWESWGERFSSQLSVEWL